MIHVTRTHGAPLEVLGLDGRSALVYTHLCLHGATKAGPIATTTRLGRGDVYRALDDLTARGYVLAGQDRPTTYMAVDPDEVFARAIAESRARKAAIVEAAAILSSWWTESASSRRSDREAFRHFDAEADIEAVSTRMVKRATRVILFVEKRPITGSRSDGLHAKTLRVAARSRVELRVVGTASLWFLVVDEKEALFIDEKSAEGTTERRGLRATWTDSPTLVAMAVALHDSLSRPQGEIRGERPA